MSLPAARAETRLATMYTGERDAALLAGSNVKVLLKTQMKLISSSTQLQNKACKSYLKLR